LTGGLIWDFYTPERLLLRTTAVYKAALHGYEALVHKWFPEFADRLRTAVTLPARLLGRIVSPGASRWETGQQASMHWHLEARPPGAESAVEISFGDDGGFRQARFAAAFDALRSYRREAADLIGGPSIHTQSLSVVVSEVSPATELAYTWLWDDLRRVSWVQGLLGRR
jgi:hypothetical protein